MPTPKVPPRFSPMLADLYQRLHAIAESERMTSLVDYLEDLRKEFDWAAAELKTLGFCAPCYLSELDNGDGHDCVGEG
jgi:hypothetical protein